MTKSIAQIEEKLKAIKLRQDCYNAYTFKDAFCSMYLNGAESALLWVLGENNRFDEEV